MIIHIFGINYTPELSGIGPYTTILAEYLAEQHDVVVYTGIPHYPTWTVGTEYTATRSSEELINGVVVRRFGHYVPQSQGAIHRLVYEATWAARVYLHARKERPDLRLAVSPPLLAGPLVRMLTGRRCPYGVIVQDVVSVAALETGVGANSAVAALTRWLETWGFARAGGIVTVHGTLARSIKQLTKAPERVSVIFNWSHVKSAALKSREDTRRLMGWTNQFVVLHSGNMGLKQDLGAVLEAARFSARQGLSSLRFALVGGGSQFDSLREAAKDLPNVDVLESVSDALYPGLLASADVLLVNERPGMVSASMPSKLTSYLTAARPIVAAVEAESATAKFLKGTGAALLVKPRGPEELAQAVLLLERDPKLSAHLGERGAEFAASDLTQSDILSRYADWIQSLGGMDNSREGHR